MKKYFYITCAYVLGISQSFADLKDDISPASADDSIRVAWSGEVYLDAVLLYVKDTIFMFMAVIAIGVFLFIWGKLVMARWNPEEFKKALQSFIYAAVGIFVVAFAWAIVKLVVGLDI